MRRALLGLAAALAFAAPAQADTITVTSFDDSPDAACPGTECSIRAAITLSRENGGTESPDTIVVPAGTYQLTQGQLESETTNQDVTIAGAGADRTLIRAQTNNRVFELQGESSFTLRGLTLAGGNTGLDPEGYGGNVWVWAGELRLDHVRLTGGRAARGGAIAAENAQIVASQTLIDNNSASTYGGGIATFNGSEFSLLTSTVTGNSAPEGGGIAISDQQTVTTIIGLSTIAHNTSNGVFGGGIAVRNTATAPTVVASILAGNRGQAVPGGPLAGRNCTADLVDGGGNVESGTECGFTRPQSRQTPATGLATELVNDGGTLPVLPISADSPARDLAGPCTSPDQRDVQRPQGAACDAGAYEYVEPAPQPPVVTPTPTPAPPIVTPTPTPVVNQTIVVGPARGTVRVKLRGSRRYQNLDATQGIPVGSTVDTRKGRVTLTSIPKTGAAPETAVFYDGIFRVTQTRGVTNLTLTEQLARCPKKGRAATAAKKKSRKLWGKGKGAFRTTGRYSAATVRGTTWLVQDSCAGTLTRVTHGSVTVQHRNKRIIVRAGKRYLARPNR